MPESPATAPSLTPRKRKTGVTNSKLPGIKSFHLRPEKVAQTVRKRLNLSYDPHEWKSVFITKVVQGYDGILCAGTSYGKSLVFEGVAAMLKEKTIIVVCPLKVLELDQGGISIVREAQAKNLRAIALNEDAIKADPKLWSKVLSEKPNIIYGPG